MIKLKSLFRRGSPSSPSSKQTNLISPAHSVGLKTSQSASSLDQIGVLSSGSASADLGATRKLKNNKQSSKDNKHSSKDKLNDLLKTSSKEKIFDDKKEIKRIHKQKQMQQVERHSPIEHRAERAKDSNSTAVNGIQDVSFESFFSHYRPLRIEALNGDISQTHKRCSIGVVFCDMYVFQRIFLGETEANHAGASPTST